MKIAEYIEKFKPSKSALAREAGISRNTLINILDKGIMPTIKTAVAIERATHGMVSIRDWLDESDVKESHKVHNDKKKHPKKTPLKN